MWIKRLLGKPLPGVMAQYSGKTFLAAKLPFLKESFCSLPVTIISVHHTCPTGRALCSFLPLITVLFSSSTYLKLVPHAKKNIHGLNSQCNLIF